MLQKMFSRKYEYININNLISDFIKMKARK